MLPDNPMDHEAAARGTTVYLVDKRIDMLPSLLGTNLCSLRPHVERLAFSVIWVRDLSDSSTRGSYYFYLTGVDERGGNRQRALHKVGDCFKSRLYL